MYHTQYARHCGHPLKCSSSGDSWKEKKDTAVPQKNSLQTKESIDLNRSYRQIQR